ncbi:MAG: TlpA disulfide reductase family protein [Candidatus Thiodiazotropha sp.]
MRRILTLFLLFLSGLVMADELPIEDRDGNEITIQKQPADGDLLVIWFVDHAEPREPFDNLLSQLSRDGIEIWRVDLLAAYFLPRSSETVRTLPGDGVAAVISAAHRLSDKRILLASYDRMPLPMLRGVRLWQQQAESSRLLGALLYYPNLFGPAPLAGQDPLVDPILQATNIPLVIYQPELGSQRWRLQQVMQPLWQGGAPAYVYLVPGVRDWFFMGEGDHGPGEKSATDAVPQQMAAFASLLATHTVPKEAMPLPDQDMTKGEIRTLVSLSQPQPISPFTLQTIEGSPYDSASLSGKVVLLNFWATWCPPCVEELPSLNRLQQRYSGSDLRVVSIDFRETPEEMKAFLQRTPVEFPVLMDQDGKVSLAWRVFSFPSSFIIDRTGHIRYSANRAIDWNSPEVWDAIDPLLESR